MSLDEEVLDLNEEFVKLKLKDFIPVLGAIGYYRRTDDLESLPINRDVESFFKFVFLMAYNMAYVFAGSSYFA